MCHVPSPGKHPEAIPEVNERPYMPWPEREYRNEPICQGDDISDLTG